MNNLRAIPLVFQKLQYLALATVISFAVFVLSTWLQNLAIVGFVITSSAPLSTKATLFASMIGSISTNFSVFTASYTIAIAVLFGVNVALVAHYFTQRKGLLAKSRETGGSVLGLISGMMGIGCAACGSIIITSFLSLIGATGLLAFLPLGGSEFGLIGVVILMFSIYSISKKIIQPQVCATIEK